MNTSLHSHADAVSRPPVLRLRDASLTLGDRQVLHRVDLVVSPSTRLCVVGENGTGKTTLLRLLSGEAEPDVGSLDRAGSLGVVHQEMPVADGATVGDLVADALAAPHAALAGLERATDGLAVDAPRAADDYQSALDEAVRLDAWDADRRLDVSLAALDACSDRERVLATMSSGERHRVRLACVLGGSHDLVLLDEPTNHLDAGGLEFLTGALLARSGWVVVSHDRALLREVAGEVMDLDPSDDGRPRVYGGGYDQWQSGRTGELARWREMYTGQVAEQQRLRSAVDEARSRLSDRWRPEKGTGKHARQSRAPGVVQSLRRHEQQLRDHRVDAPPPPAAIDWPDPGTHAGRPVLRVDGVSVAGRLRGPVSFRLGGGDRLLVTGPNGAGKSTLVDVVSGGLLPGTGSARLLSGASLGVLAQETDAERGDARGWSPGQLRRTDLSRVLRARPDVLVLDEPSNHLAAWVVDELTEHVRRTTAAVVVVTHDRQLSSDLSDWPVLRLGGREA